MKVTIDLKRNEKNITLNFSEKIEALCNLSDICGQVHSHSIST